MDDSRIDSIKNFKIPDSRKKLRAFLGLTNFYRKFIRDYGKIAAPLNKLTSEKVVYKWDEKIYTPAFVKLKEALMSPAVLSYPDFDKQFQICVDASGLGIGAVLFQNFDGKERPIAFASRPLSEIEKRRHKDSATEKEMLGIIWSVKHFRQYLYGKFLRFGQITSHCLHLKQCQIKTQF